MTSRQVNLLIAVIIMIAHASAVLAQTRAVPGSSGSPRLSNAPGKKHGPPGKEPASNSSQDTRVISGSETTNYNDETGILVSPRGGWAWPTFAELAEKGGPRVSALGPIIDLWVPADLRFRPVAGRQLVDTVAAGHGFNTIWLRDGQHVIIYAGAEKDEDLQRVEKDLSSTNALVRRNAVWDGVQTWDVRAVPLIAKAAQDENADVAREAMAGLETLGWDNVFLLLGDAALPLAAIRLKSRDEYSREALAYGLALGGEGAIPLLESALADWYVPFPGGTRKVPGDSRYDAVWALGQIGGEKALAILRKTLGDSDYNLRGSAVWAMGRPGDNTALPILEQLVCDKDVGIREGAVYALGRMRAIKLLEQVPKQDLSLVTLYTARLTIMMWADRVERRLQLMEEGLGDKERLFRQLTARALGGAWDDPYSGGSEYAKRVGTAFLDRKQVLVLARKAARDSDNDVRRAVAGALGRIGGDEALALLEDLFAKDRSANVRQQALASLGNLGDKKATAIIAAAFTQSRDPGIRAAAYYGLGFSSDPTVVPLLETVFLRGEPAAGATKNQTLLGSRKQSSLNILTSETMDVTANCAYVLSLRGSDAALAAAEREILGDKHKEGSIGSATKVWGERGHWTKVWSERGQWRVDPNGNSSLATSPEKSGGSCSGNGAMSFDKWGSPNDRNKVWGGSPCHAGREVWGRYRLTVTGSELPRKDKARMRAFLERVESSGDPRVRYAVMEGYAVVGGEKAFAFLSAMIRDSDNSLRNQAAYVMGMMGGARVRDLLIGRLTQERDTNVLQMIRHSLQECFPEDPVAEQALKNAGARAQQ